VKESEILLNLSLNIAGSKAKSPNLREFEKKFARSEPKVTGSK